MKMYDVVLYVSVPVGEKEFHHYLKDLQLPFAPTKGLRISSHIDEHSDGYWWIDIESVEWNIEGEVFWCDIVEQDYYACDSKNEADEWWIGKGFEYVGHDLYRELCKETGSDDC